MINTGRALALLREGFETEQSEAGSPMMRAIKKVLPRPLTDFLFEMIPSLCPVFEKRTRRRPFALGWLLWSPYFVHNRFRECREIDVAVPDETDLDGECTRTPYRLLVQQPNGRIPGPAAPRLRS